MLSHTHLMFHMKKGMIRSLLYLLKRKSLSVVKLVVVVKYLVHPFHLKKIGKEYKSRTKHQKVFNPKLCWKGKVARRLVEPKAKKLHKDCLKVKRKETKEKTKVFRKPRLL